MITLDHLRANPLRLSYSTFNLLHGCERKFQLIKLLKSDEQDTEAPQFSYGHCFGDGVAEYLKTGDMDWAVYSAWMSYWPIMEDMKRSQWLAINAVIQAKDKLDRIRKEWEVATFNGKPAAELSFRLNINDWCYFVGYIDAVLKHKATGHYAVLEVKHTTSILNDLLPLYKNSGQALGYSIVLDKIANQPLGEYALFYFVGQMKKPHEPLYHTFEWKKSLLDRLNWFLTLGMDVERLQRMIELGLFPMRGGHCISYNKVCPFFGTCGLHSFDTPATRDPDTTPYQFTYSLDEIIADHLARVRSDFTLEPMED